MRADLTFGESIIDIADDAREDWIPAKNGGAPCVNKELVLRSKLRIAARQLHMSRLQPQTWGDKQIVGIKNDWALLSEDELRRRTDELYQVSLNETHVGDSQGEANMIHRGKREGVCHGGCGSSSRGLRSRANTRAGEAV